MVFGDIRNRDALVDFLKANDIFVGDDVDDLEYSDDGIPVYDPKYIEYVNTHLKKEYLKDKESILDVLVKLKSGKQVNLELQIESKEAFEKRIAYYAMKGFVSQLAEGEDYVELKPFVSIVIVDFPVKVLARRKKFYTYFYIHSREDDITLFEDFQIRIIELPKLVEYVEETKLYTWAKFIATDDTEAKKAMAENNVALRNTIDFMQSLSADKLARLYYEAGVKKARDTRAERAYAVNAERDKWVSVIAEKDTALAEQAAEIAALKAQLNLQS
ncbi:hypothetical protein FACS1894188_08340 [Clostridia bacterium]|nr:hypothetical protein FACS1894188_08340 [Clostridia bacterium]